MPTCTSVLSFIGTLYYIWWYILFRSVLKCLKPTSVALISCCPRPHWTTWPYSLHMRSRGGDLRPPGTSCPFTSQKSAHMSPSAHHGPWWSIWPWSTSATTPKDNVVGARLKVIVVGPGLVYLFVCFPVCFRFLCLRQLTCSCLNCPGD